MKTLEFCKKYNACRSGREYAGQFKTMAKVWDACERPDWLLWILERHRPLTRIEAVTLAIEFATDALQYLPGGETRPRLAIDAARAWLSSPTPENRDRCRTAAAAARDGAASYAVVYAVIYAVAVAVAGAVSYADAAAYAAYAAYAATYASADAASRAARQTQCDTIRALIANPFTL